MCVLRHTREGKIIKEGGDGWWNQEFLRCVTQDFLFLEEDLVFCRSNQRLHFLHPKSPFPIILVLPPPPSSSRISSILLFFYVPLPDLHLSVSLSFDSTHQSTTPLQIGALLSIYKRVRTEKEETLFWKDQSLGPPILRPFAATSTRKTEDGTRTTENG